MLSSHIVSVFYKKDEVIKKLYHESQASANLTSFDSTKSLWLLKPVWIYPFISTGAHNFYIITYMSSNFLLELHAINFFYWGQPLA